MCFLTSPRSTTNNTWAALLLGTSLSLGLFGRLRLYASWFGRGSLGRVFREWRPFRGPEIFVMCEAISWTLFSIGALADLILLNTFVFHGVKHQQQQQHQEHHHQQENDAVAAPFFGWTTAVSLSHLFAHVVLRYGVEILQQEEFRRASDCGQCRDL